MTTFEADVAVDTPRRPTVQNRSGPSDGDQPNLECVLGKLYHIPPGHQAEILELKTEYQAAPSKLHNNTEILHESVKHLSATSRDNVDMK